MLFRQTPQKGARFGLRMRRYAASEMSRIKPLFPQRRRINIFMKVQPQVNTENWRYAKSEGKTFAPSSGRSAFSLAIIGLMMDNGCPLQGEWSVIISINTPLNNGNPESKTSTIARFQSLSVKSFVAILRWLNMP